MPDPYELLGPGNPNNEMRKQMERESNEAFNMLIQEQQAPQKGSGEDCWLLVLADMEERRQMGIVKYGEPVRADNGRDALIDAYQEALDLCVYLRQEIEKSRIAKAGVAAGTLTELAGSRQEETPAIAGVEVREGGEG